MHKLRETFEDEESSELDESGGDNSDSDSDPESNERQSRSKKTKNHLHHKDSDSDSGDEDRRESDDDSDGADDRNVRRKERNQAKPKVRSHVIYLRGSYHRVRIQEDYKEGIYSQQGRRKGS